eukprot:6021948-Pyramimonas_sp.AAC.1
MNGRVVFEHHVAAIGLPIREEPQHGPLEALDAQWRHNSGLLVHHIVRLVQCITGLHEVLVRPTEEVCILAQEQLAEGEEMPGLGCLCFKAPFLEMGQGDLSNAAQSTAASSEYHAVRRVARLQPP